MSFGLMWTSPHSTSPRFLVCVVVGQGLVCLHMCLPLWRAEVNFGHLSITISITLHLIFSEREGLSLHIDLAICHFM